MGFSGSDDVEVQVSNPDGSYTTVLTTPTSTVGWEELSYDLSAYVGQVVKVRFVGTSVYGTAIHILMMLVLLNHQHIL